MEIDLSAIENIVLLEHFKNILVINNRKGIDILGICFEVRFDCSYWLFVHITPVTVIYNN